MSIVSKIKSWVKRTFGGGSSSRSSSRSRASRVSNYGGGGSRSYSDYSSGGYRSDYEDRQEAERRRRQEQLKKRQATTNALASISKRTDALSSGRSSSVAGSATSTGNGTAKVLAKIEQKATPPDVKLKQDAAKASRERATKMLKKIESDRKSYNKATGHKYDTEHGTKEERARARQRIKAGEYQSDPNAEKWEVKHHPIAASAARGGLSGVTFGGSELVAKKSKKRQETGAEQYYQANKNKKAEFAGEMIGSLAAFGATNEASAKAIGKVAPRLINPSDARIAKIAGRGYVRRAAEEEMARLVKKGVVKEGSEELLERLVRDRAKRIAIEKGKDTAINLTTGGLSDVLHSAADSDNLGDFAKEMAFNVPINYGLGAATTVLPELRVGRGFLGLRGGVRDEALDTARRYADDVANAARQAAQPQTLDDAVERAAVEAVEAREVARQADEAMRPQSVNNPVGSEYVAMSDAGSSTAKTVDRDALRKELRSNREEIERIQQEILDEHGEFNPDWGKLSAEEQASLAAKKNRLKELTARNNAIGDELSASARASASGTKKELGKSKREELDAVEAEYKKLRRSLKNDQKKIADGKEVDLATLEAKEKKLAEIEDQRDALRRELGTAKKTRKERSKAEPPKEKLSKADVAKSAKQAETKAEAPKYEDIDLSKGLSEEERAVARSKMNELDAERNRLLATDENNPRVEELGAEISNIKRALERDAGEPAKKVDVDAVNAEKAAKEAKAKAERNANAKPINETRQAEAKPNEEPKPKSEKKKRSEAAKKAQRDAKLEKEHAEYAKNVDSTSEGEYAANKTTVGIGKASPADRQRRITSDLKRANQAMRESGQADLKHAHKVRGANYENELASKSLEKVSKDRASVEKRLRLLYKEVKEAEKADEIKHISLEDLSDIYAVLDSYDAQGKKVPAKLADTLEQLQELQGTQMGQGLKMIHIMRMNRSPEYRKAFATRDFKAYVKRFGAGDKEWKQISDSMKAKTGKSLDDRIAEWASATKMTKEEQEQMYAQLQIDVFRHTEPSVMDTINLWRHMFLLSKPTTALNNILGNTLMYTMSGINDRVRYYAEKALKAKLGDAVEATTTLTKNINEDGRKLMSWGAKNADYKDKAFAERINETVAKAVKDIMGDNKWETNLEKGLDFDYGRNVFAQAKGGFTKAGAKGNKFVGMMLNKPDEWFVEKNYRAQLIKYLYANGIDSAEKLAKNPDILMRAEDHAAKMAKENTFKTASQLVNMLDKYRQAGYKKGSSIPKKVGAMVLDANIPFAKVPWNLVKVNTKYSPIGAVWNAGAASRALATAKSAAKSGDDEAFNAAVQLLEYHTGEMSKGLTGTGLAALGFFLNCDDASDDDSWGFIAKADKNLKEYNVRDYSFKIGNKNLSLANTGIGTIQFLIGAQYADWINEMGGLPKALRDDPTAVITSLAMTFAPISDMSLVDNIVSSAKSFTYGSSSDDWNVVSGLGNVLQQSAGNYAGQFVPSPLRAIARGTSNADIDTGVKRGSSNAQRVKNNLVSGVPVLNEKALPHKVDTHGNLINERKTVADKAFGFGKGGVVQNLVDPFSTRTINIPKADKVELSVKNEKGVGYKPRTFDANRDYQAKIGTGENAEFIDLTGKDREQVARSGKRSGYDMADNLVARGWFGDSHGERAQQILRTVPEDEEKAREMFYKTPEFNRLSDENKTKFFNDLYGRNTQKRRGNTGRGRARTENYEAYVNVNGGDEGDFRFQNDLHRNYQNKYREKGLDKLGVSKGQWADIIESAKYESHKYKDGKNVDTIQAYGLKKALLEDESLTTEQRIAIYQAERGKRNGFGWYDWNGVSLKGGYRRRGYRRRGWRHYGHGHSSKKAKVPTPKTIKANQFVKGEALGNTTKSSSTTKSSAKTTPPTLKRVEAKIDLPTVKTTTKKR